MSKLIVGFWTACDGATPGTMVPPAKTAARATTAASRNELRSKDNGRTLLADMQLVEGSGSQRDERYGEKQRAVISLMASFWFITR